jgi:hypothetical protein
MSETTDLPEMWKSMFRDFFAPPPLGPHTPRNWWAVVRAGAVADALGVTPLDPRRAAVVDALADGFVAATGEATSYAHSLVPDRRDRCC